MRRIVYLLFMAMGVFSLEAIEQPVQQPADAQIWQNAVKQDNSYFSDGLNDCSGLNGCNGQPQAFRQMLCS